MGKGRPSKDNTITHWLPEWTLLIQMFITCKHYLFNSPSSLLEKKKFCEVRNCVFLICPWPYHHNTFHLVFYSFNKVKIPMDR